VSETGRNDPDPVTRSSGCAAAVAAGSFAHDAAELFGEMALIRESAFRGHRGDRTSRKDQGVTTHPDAQLPNVGVGRAQIHVPELAMERTKGEAAALGHRSNADRLVIVLLDERHRRSQSRFRPDFRSLLYRHRRHARRSDDAAAGVAHGSFDVTIHRGV
jgi:hypothetical protein